MMPAPLRALIYMTGRNCERYVRAAIESVAWQTHAAVHLLFVDDCSDDRTGTLARQALAQHLPGRHTIVRNPEPWGKARNAHVHLRAALAQGDFVAILDADDQLIRASVLAEMATHYAAGHDVVWTNYETDAGAVGSCGPLDPLLPPRGQGWRTSHFFSFRAELFANVPEDYLRDERGEWFPAACDFAIAYPVLDQTRRYKFMPVRAYRYTASNPTSHHNNDPQAAGLSSRRQQQCARQVLDKPALACTRWALGERAGGDEALLALRHQLRADLLVIANKVDAVATSGAATAPAARPAASDAAPADDAWTQAAAATLAQRCPALLALMMDGQAAPLPLADAWRWWTWLQAGDAPPAVLELGAGPLAAPLRAMVEALGGRFTSVSGDRQRAMDLWARLDAAGLDADVVHAPMVEVALDAQAGVLPGLGALPPEAAGFNVLVASAPHAGNVPADALLALPAAAERMHPDGFRACLWAPEDAPLRARAAELWGALAPELKFTDRAFAGKALCVHAA